MDGHFKLAISALSHDGRGIGFLDSSADSRGKAVFVSGALPGQTAICVKLKDKGSFIEAKAREIIHSDWAPNALCPHWRECGACPLLPMPYGLQLEWKMRLAADALVRIGKMSEDAIARIMRPPLASPLLAGFRNKIELAFGKDANGLALGFRQRRSHNVFTLKNCLIIPDSALPIIEKCRDTLSGTGFEPFIRHGDGYSGFLRFLILRQGIDPRAGKAAWRALLLTSRGEARQRKLLKDACRELLAQCPQLAGFIHEEREKRDLLAKGQRRIFCLDENGDENPAAAIFRLPNGKLFFELDISSFFQVNTEAASLMGKMLQNMDARHMKTTEGSLLDLYCGVGSPGQLLAPAYAHALGVESDALAIEFAKKNAARAGQSQWEHLAGDAAKITGGAKMGGAGFWKTVLLDPPRGGLSPLVLENLVKMAPENILYVSCKAATMARDALVLNRGHNLVQLGLVDFFPHTPHMECCGLWRKKG